LYEFFDVVVESGGGFGEVVICGVWCGCVGIVLGGFSNGGLCVFGEIMWW